MTDWHNNNELLEQELDKRYREVSESLEKLEQARLKDIFLTLDLLKSEIETGNRKAMLELLQITADSLKLCTPPSQECRESLADCLVKMRNNLEDSNRFLPIKRGGRPVKWVREQESMEFWTAFQVEYLRRFEGFGLEDAVAKVSEDHPDNMSDYLAHKRWKRKHKDVDESLALAYAMLLERGINMPKLLKPKRKPNPKKVR